MPVIYTPGKSAQMATGRGKRRAWRLVMTTKTGRGHPMNRCAKQRAKRGQGQPISRMGLKTQRNPMAVRLNRGWLCVACAVQLHGECTAHCTFKRRRMAHVVLCLQDGGEHVRSSESVAWESRRQDKRCNQTQNTSELM